MNDTLAGASPVDQPVRPLSARLDVLRVLLAERHPDHHATVNETQAEIERLRAALTLAANRMDVLALDHDYGTTRRYIADDWAKETRAALWPNAELGQVVEAMGAYWDAAYAEGREGRTHDTVDGAAETARRSVMAAINALAAAERERWRGKVRELVMRESGTRFADAATAQEVLHELVQFGA